MTIDKIGEIQRLLTELKMEHESEINTFINDYEAVIDEYKKELKNVDNVCNSQTLEIRRLNILLSEYEGSGRGMGEGVGLGPSGYCKCPNCDYTVSHDIGVPCNQQICPKCGMLMIRA